ncbi:lactate utilization protein C [Wenjunlia vitaminophila]|uniref:Lactate utilization protein C n=1 Tax=Wenjunlia vitaminophila TaxID=76728 RepID=A0A0T6LP38_WENVI|nr:LUD domain-containing protein [Wenjunlia vitaminophila]KRV47885.1 lactate utilization protein C [Wenjunlia vitaminophila]
MSSRQEILTRIAGALRDVPEDEGAEAAPADRRSPVVRHPPDPVALFAERAAEYRAAVTRTTESEASAAIGAALAARSPARLVVPHGFPEAWLPARRTWQRLEDDPPLRPAQLDAADGALTTCALAVAETGTLVLDAGPGQGRRALTLLPDFHLCVLRSAQIAPDVPTALRGLDPCCPLTFVSGPSATSDIELERVEGVHGPRVLHIVIVEPDSRGADTHP